MDGDDLESEPSQASDSISLAEIFRDAFPYYLSMGMTYDEFWYGDPTLARDYRKAYAMKRSQRNWEMWQQGLYIFKALRCAPLAVGFVKGEGSTDQYPSEPFPLSEKEAEEQRQRAARERYYHMREKLMEEAKERQKRRGEEAEKKEAVIDGRC